MRERKSSRNILLRWSTIAKMLGELEYNFGKLAAKNGKPDDAKKHYADSDKHYKKLNDISRKLATSDELIDGVRDYSRSFYTLGLVEDLNGRPGKAREYYQRSREIRELALRDYANHRVSAHLQIDLLFSQIALGEIRAAMDLAENMVWVFNEEPDAESLYEVDYDARNYKRLFFLGDKLVGAILIGKMRGRKKVLELISSRTSIEERKKVFELLAMPEVPAKAAAPE